MASRVNVKFVLILSAALTIVFAGVAGVALWVLSNNGPRLEREGDQLMAAGEFEIAKKVYGKAYNKDRSSIVRLDKYIKAIEAWTPEVPTEYSDAYAGELLSAFHTHATILRTDFESHKRYLEARHLQVRWSPSAAGWEFLASSTDDALGYFESDATADDMSKGLLRFRGLALVELMSIEGESSSGRSSTNRETDQAEKDLKSALQFNPDDTAAAIGLSRYYETHARQLRSSRRTQDEADQTDLLAFEVIDTFLASHPLETEALTHRIVLSYMQAAASLDESLSDSETLAAHEAIRADLSGPLDNLFEALAQRPVDNIDPLHVGRIATIEQSIAGESVRSADLIDRVLRARPTDPAMLDGRALLARRQGEYERALGLYQQISSMEWPPVSLEGMILLMLQEKAVVAMPDAALVLWELSPDEDKSEALLRTKALRADAGELVRDTDPRLVLLDGKIAFAEEKYTLAQEKLSAFNELSMGTNPLALGMLAEIHLKGRELGSARDVFLQLVELQPRVGRHYISLAQVEFGLKNYQSARGYAQQAVDIDPEDADAAELLSQLEGFANPAAIAATKPVEAALIQARLLAQGNKGAAPDLQGAILLLTGVLDSQDTTSADFETSRERLVVMRIELLSISGDRETALEQTRQWKLVYPESEAIAALELRLTVPNTLEGDLQIIDASTEEGHTRLVSKYLAALRRGEEERATEFITEALQIAPDQATVVEVAFGDALRRSEFDLARQLADTAAQANLDRVNGDSFSARIQAAQGDLAGAVTKLGQATQIATAPAGVWRLLGQYQTQLGRYSEAITSLEEALNRSPNDVNSVLFYVETLIRAGRNAEALRVARRYESLAGSNNAFVAMWLSLEAQFGDKAIALSRREEIQKRLPDNRQNTIALIAMFIDLDRVEEARSLLEVLRGEDADLSVATLDAQLSQTEGKTDAARATFETYIAARKASPEGAEFADYAAYATFLVKAQLVDEAISALNAARSVQDPGVMEADVAIGSLLFDIGRFEEAIEPLERAVATGAASVRVTLAKALFQSNRFADAKKVIADSNDEWEKNLELSLVMIECVNAEGDRPGALRMVDTTARDFYTSPLPYITRARLRIENGSLLDALDDLNTAVLRDPTHWIALSLRAEVNRRLGNEDAALQDLRKAVRSNPTLDYERRMLMLNLFRIGRYRDAKTIADEAIAARPDDFELLISMGDIFAGAAAWDYASSIFAVAWEQAPSEPVAMRYVASLIRSANPALNEADRVLADPMCKTDTSAGMLVLRASLRMKQEQPNIARRDAARAVQLATENLALAARVLEELNSVFDTPQETAQFVLQQDLSAMAGNAGSYFHAVAMLQIADRVDEALDLLRQLSVDKSDPVILSNARRMLVTILLNPIRGEYAEALELMIIAIEEEPDPWMYANNIAYVLAKELDRPEEALVYAERAKAIDPNNATVLDTLGYVYRRLKRYDDAERVLGIAIELAPDAWTRLNTLLHLGQTHAEQSDRDQAQKAMDEINSILAALGQDASDNQEVADLRTQIEGLK